MPESRPRRTELHVLPTEEAMGAAAARDVGDVLRDMTEAGRPALLNLAAAPSQDAFLASLARQAGIDWDLVQAIHLDEYYDLPRGHANTFERYLDAHIFSRVPIPVGNVHLIKAMQAGGPEELADAYAQRALGILGEVRGAGGLYLACIGIGVNGHIAFNEPHVDKRTGRFAIAVEMDERSVQQQYDDYREHPDPAARYAALADVPRRAVTVSCAGILAADRIFCVVPGAHKAQAARAMLEGPITDDLPASLLRLHPACNVYLDAASASLLDCRPELNG
jgi:glucosamine-6-phosphate deaminase